MRHILIGIFTMLLVSSCSWIMPKPTRVDNPVVKGVHYVAITVSDIERATALYKDSVDLKVAKEEVLSNNPVLDTLSGRDNVSIKTQLLRSVNAQIRFMEFEHPVENRLQPSPVNGPGIAHVCYQVNQVTNAYERFLAGGGKHIGKRELVKSNPDNPVVYGYAHDHDNAIVEIEEVDVEAFMEKYNVTTPPKNKYRIRHASFGTFDMERAIDFYSVLLETKNPRRSGNFLKRTGSTESLEHISGIKGAEIEMGWFQVRNLELEFIQYHTPAPTPLAKPRTLEGLGYSMVVFDVTSLAAAKEKLLAAGGSIEIEEGMLDGAPALFGRDPDGNLLGFQVLPEDSHLTAKNFANNGIG